MYVSMVTFTVDKGEEARLENKAKHDLESLQNWPDCLSAEYWISQEDEEMSYTLVTKWAEKADQQKWVTRPEHTAHHKAAALKQKETGEKPKKFKKERREFEVFSG